MEYKCISCKTTFTPDKLLQQTSYSYLPNTPGIVCDSCEPGDYLAIQNTVKVIARSAGL